MCERTLVGDRRIPSTPYVVPKLANIEIGEISLVPKLSNIWLEFTNKIRRACAGNDPPRRLAVVPSPAAAPLQSGTPVHTNVGAGAANTGQRRVQPAAAKGRRGRAAEDAAECAGPGLRISARAELFRPSQVVAGDTRTRAASP